MANRIEFEVGYKLDQNALNQLKNSLQAVQQQATKTGSDNPLKKQFDEAAASARELEKILDGAWNSKLGQLNLSKVNEGIKTTYGSVEQMRQAMVQGGAQGAAAYNKVASAVLNTNLQLKNSSKLLDDMAVSMKNTVKWGITSSIFNNLTGSIQKAWSYTKNLDTSLNDIRIVTGQSAEKMEEFARTANSAAKNLGASTLDYTNAALIYYQQGLDDAEVQARAETTLKAANVTGQRGEEVSEQLTAVWNGYKVTAEETELYVDKLAAVAASTASDLEELSTGMSKVASAGAAMGVGVDSLNAQLATIISVTRQAPESVGTALKTIYARMANIKAGLTEDDVDLQSYTKKMADMGISVLDAQNHLRDMEDVIEEVGTKWQTMTREQQVALAQIMAGARQYNNLVALFDNWDMYTDALETSANAAGTLQEQQDIYMESTEAHLQKLRTESQRTYDILFNQDTVNGFADALTGVLTVFNNYIDALGGGAAALTNLGAIATRVFNQQIGNGIARGLQNTQIAIQNAAAEALKQEIIQNHAVQGDFVTEAQLKAELKIAQRINEVRKGLTQEEYERLTALQQAVGESAKEVAYYEEYEQILKDININENTSLSTLEKKASILERDNEAYQNAKTALQELVYLAEEEEDIKSDMLTEDELTLNLLDDIATFYQYIGQDAEVASASTEAITEKVLEGKFTSEDVEQIFKEQNIDLEQQLAIQEKLNSAIERKRGIVNGDAAAAQARLKDQRGFANKDLDAAVFRKQTQEMVEGLSALAMGITTVTGLFRTLGDESLSAGEKFERVSTMLIFNLPMIISGFSGLASTLPVIAKALVPVAVGLGATGEAATAAGAQGVAAILSVETAAGPLGWVLMGITIAVVALTGAIYAGVKAYNADANAAKEAAEAAQQFKKANEDLKESFDELKSSIDSYKDALEALDDLTEGTEEYAAAVEEANEKALALAETNIQLQAAMYRGADGVLRFKDSILEMVEADAKATLANSTQNALLKQIDANEKKAKSNVTDLGREGVGERAYNSSWQGISQDVVDQLRDIYEENGNIVEADVSKLSGASDALKSSIIKNWSSVVDLIESNSTLEEANKVLAAEIASSYMGDHNKSYQEATTGQQAALDRLIGDYRDNDAYQDAFNDKLAELKNVFDDYNDKDLHDEYADALKYTVAKGGIGSGKYVTASGETITVSDEDARNYLAAQAALKAVADEDSDTFKNAERVVDKLQRAGEDLDDALGTEGMADELLGFVQKADTHFDQLTDMSPEDVEKIREAIAEGALSRITDADAEAMGYKDAQAFVNGVQRALDEYDPTAYWKGQYKQSLGNQDIISKGITSAQEGDELEEEDQAALNALLAKYIDLQDLRNMNDHEYLELLRDIQEKEENRSREALENTKSEAEARRDQLKATIAEKQAIIDEWDSKDWRERILAGPIEAARAAKAKITIQADTEELEQTLQEIQDTDYEIKMQIDADLSTDVDQAFGLAEEFDALQDRLSESLEITFDEAQEIIAQGYGAMLENARETADQTMILDREVVNSFIDGKRVELNADKESKIEQLEAERVLLETRRDILQKKVEALSAAAEAENATDAATALAKAKLLDQELANNQVALNQLLSDEEDKNAEVAEDNTRLGEFLAEVDGNIAENAGLAAESAKNSVGAMAESAIDYANQVGAAWQAAWQAMESGEYSPQTFSPSGASTASTYTSTSLGSTYEKTEFTLENLTNSILEAADNNTEAIKAEANHQRELAQQELDSVNAQIGAVDAGIAALKSAGDSLDEAQRTAGTKEPGSKSGGGSEKEKDPDHMDYLDDEIDKYHDINNELKQIASTLGILQGQEDKYIRSGLTYNLEKQLEVLHKQEDAQRRKLALAQADLKAQTALLQAKGVQIGEDGQILNYAGILAAKQAEINALIAEYNGLSAEDQEGYKSVIEQKKQEYEQLKSQMAAYDTLLNDTIPQLISDIQDTVDAEIEAQIKKFNVMIEAHLDIKDLEEEWNEFKGKVILDLDDDDYIGKAKLAMERFSNYYQSDGSGIVQDLTQHVREITEQVRQIEATGTSSIYGDNEAAAMEDLRKYNTELMNSLEEIEDLEGEVYEDYLDLIDKAQDAFDKQVKTYEQITDIIEHDMELTRLLWGDDAYNTLDKYYTMQEQNNNQQLDFLRKQTDAWKQLMDNEEEGSEAWEKYRENWMQSVSDLNSLVEDSVQNLLDKYSNVMSKIINDLNQKITGGKGLDYVSEEWDLINREADQYLDTINAGYAIQKLENEINQSLNDLQGNVAAQQALNKLRDEELQKLKDKEKITEYDVERAELMYQIALKQIALEQAQQNKSSMRLRRDSQGNYTYQYVADDDQIAEAQQALSEAQNNLFNLDKDAYKENLDSIYEIYNEFQEKVLELYQDMTLSDEEREAKKQLYAQYYGDMINNLVTENEYIRLNLMDSTFQSLADLYDQDVQNFYNMSQEEQDLLINSIVPQWESSIQEMADRFAGEGGFIPTCQEAFMRLDETTSMYRQSLDNLAAAAGIDFGYIAQGIDLTIGETQALLANNGELINQYMNEISIIQSVVANLQQLIASYQGAQAAAIAAADAARQLYEAANGTAAAVNNMMNALTGGGPGGGGGDAGGGSPSGGGGNGGGGVNTGLVEGIAADIWMNGSASGWGNDPFRSGALTEKVGSDTARAVQDYINKHAENGDIYSAWHNRRGDLSNYHYSAFETGGYTGDWVGGDGKWAVLHSKELVLNASDTANMLDAVNIVRGIVDKAANLGIKLSDYGANTGSAGYSESIEQSVHIDAQFPNVTNSEEIQDAFNDLMNMASQYASANRRRK